MNVIVVACPKCKAKYKLPENARGKTVQCKNCHTKFSVGGQPRSAPSAAPSTNRPGGPPAVAATANPALTKYGLDGPIQRTPDIFEVPPPGPHDPLANHVIEDPGFAPIEIPQQQADEDEPSDDPLAGLLHNPAIEKPKVVVKKEDPLAQYLIDDDEDDLASSAGSDVDSSILLLIGAFVVLSAMYVWPLLVSRRSIHSAEPVFYGLFAFHGVVLALLGVWGCIQAHKNTKNVTKTVIAALFFPYLIYLTFKYWSKPEPMRSFGMAFIGVLIAACIGITLFVLVEFKVFMP